MVKDFKHRGVPIDGVGLQMHISELDFDAASVTSQYCRLTALGIQVHITELDVLLPLDSMGQAERKPISLQQAEVYRESRTGVPAKSGLHRDSDLGIYRQILVDRLPFSRDPRSSASL